MNSTQTTQTKPPKDAKSNGAQKVPKTPAVGELSKVATFAVDALGYLTEEMLIALFKITPVTSEDWRRRGNGPPYSVRGKEYFYHIDDIKAFIADKRREASRPHDAVSAKVNAAAGLGK
jgi:hypothetical protein